MRLIISTFAAATLTLVSAANAQPPEASPTTADARCLLAMVALSNSQDPNRQRTGQEGVLYFTGRIAARDPNFNFASLRTLAEKMDAQSAQTDLQQRCGPMFNKSMQQVTTALSGPASGAAPATPRAAPAAPKK